MMAPMLWQAETRKLWTLDSSSGKAFSDDLDAMVYCAWDGSTEEDFELRAQMLQWGNFILRLASD